MGDSWWCQLQARPYRQVKQGYRRHPEAPLVVPCPYFSLVTLGFFFRDLGAELGYLAGAWHLDRDG